MKLWEYWNKLLLLLLFEAFLRKKIAFGWILALLCPFEVWDADDVFPGTK